MHGRKKLPEKDPAWKFRCGRYFFVTVYKKKLDTIIVKVERDQQLQHCQAIKNASYKKKPDLLVPHESTQIDSLDRTSLCKTVQKLNHFENN